MSPKFPDRAHIDERAVGALVGAAFGLVTMVAGVVLADGAARATTLVLGAAVVLVAVPLGWFFARRATEPGIRSAVVAAGAITAIAVPLGALAIGTLMAVGANGLSWVEVLAAGLGLAFVGLLVLGLPLAGLTFVVASIWVGVLRLLVSERRRGTPG